jgi:hypothetical protein
MDNKQNAKAGFAGAHGSASSVPDKQTLVKHAIVRIMSHCGPADSWKITEAKELSTAIIELCLVLDDGPFTTEDAMKIAKQIGAVL